MTKLVPIERIASKIYLIRGIKIMLDRDLAKLYGVETKALKQAVRRNIDRFPDDFMFELNKDEFHNLRSQIVTSSWGGARYFPMKILNNVWCVNCSEVTGIGNVSGKIEKGMLALRGICTRCGRSVARVLEDT